MRTVRIRYTYGTYMYSMVAIYHYNARLHAQLHERRDKLFKLVSLPVQCSLSVTIYSAPQDFDSFKDYSSVIVAGSVIQLFCSASGQFIAPSIQWTWNNITVPLTAQLPHLMVKSWTVNNSLLTATVLIINGFTETDNGSYRYLAQEAGDSVGSTQLLLTGAAVTPCACVRAFMLD